MISSWVQMVFAYMTAAHLTCAYITRFTNDPYTFNYFPSISFKLTEIQLFQVSSLLAKLQHG